MSTTIHDLVINNTLSVNENMFCNNINETKTNDNYFLVINNVTGKLYKYKNNNVK